MCIYDFRNAIIKISFYRKEVNTLQRIAPWYRQLKKGSKFTITRGKNCMKYSYLRTYKDKYVFAIREENHKIYQIIDVRVDGMITTSERPTDWAPPFGITYETGWDKE